MGEPLELWYWVRGSPCSEISSVEVSQDTTIADLQQSIIKSWPSYSAKALNLYKVPEAHPVDLDSDELEDILGALSISDLGRPLRVTRRRQTVREAFASQLESDLLPLIVDFPTHPYQITCWLRGSHPDGDVPIELLGEENLRGVLKTKCKELWSKFKDLSIPDMRVYKISFDDDKELKDILDTMGYGDPIKRKDRVQDLFRDTPFSEMLCIVVEAVVSQNSAVPPSALRRGDVGADMPTVTVETERCKFLTKNQVQRPSAIASPSAFGKRQVEPTQAIPCGRPRADEDRIPVTLLHPVFAQFKEDIQSIPLTAEDDGFAFALANAMSDIYPNESQRAHTIRSLLKTYGIHLNVSKTEISEYVTDGDISAQGYRCVIAEFKNEVGSGATEPYFQAIGYYLEFTRSDAAKMFHSPLPCLLLSIFGPYIDFSGAAWNSRPTVQLLGRLAFHVHSTDIEDLLVLARYMAAFRKAIRSLEEYYETLSSPSSSGLPSSQLFPYPTTYTCRISGEKTEIVYERQVSETQLVFFGFEGSEKGHRICIKFVRRYSTDAHEYCASLGFAPTLRRFETVVGGWFMIVMDDISDGYESLFSRPVSGTVKEAMAERLSAFHKTGYVHGDLRDTNIMTCKSNAMDFKFIDFDWAGKANETTYPPFVNKGIWRPRDAMDWLPIRAGHDIEMLDHIQGWVQEHRVHEA